MTIVVGTDGSASSTLAVRWAAREAHRRHSTLRIVHAFDWEWGDARYDLRSNYAPLTRKVAESITATAYHTAHTLVPGIEIDTDTVLGHAGPTLLAMAPDAELIVLGNRGRGGFTSLLLGSVSQRIATHAPCPVVVVRGQRDAVDGPVTAGVDDTPRADGVLDVAFDAASRRKVGLTVVRSYLPPLPLWLNAGVAAADVDTAELDAAEHDQLRQLIAPWSAKYPDVPVRTVLSHDSAAAVLVDQSRMSQLVVVGSRGRGAIAGTLLGSTGIQLLHHATCPLYITR
jgi:nucleotide-binding universal stress UspA family protein